MSRSVWVNVTEARANAREAISWDGTVAWMNPGEARKFADELIAAADVVDELCPMGALKRGVEIVNARAGRLSDRCCDLHRDVDCCDPDDCGPCCDDCPTCPTLQGAVRTTASRSRT